MPQLIPTPTVIPAAGNKPKRIEEFVGRVNTGSQAISVARMTSPGGWHEPAQTPEFDEVTLVLRGSLHVDADGGGLEIGAGQAVLTRAGETVRYSTPDPDGAEYVAICTPAFSPDLVHRQAEGQPAPARAPALATAAFTIVGRVRSPVHDTRDHGWGDITSVIELDPDFHGGTQGLEEFSHVLIVYLLDRARYQPERHRVRRPRSQADMPEVGIFAQRGKDRPNPIGLTAVEIVAVEPDRLTVKGLDAIDGSPVLDIKPYFPHFDHVEEPKTPEWVGRLMYGYF